MSRTPCCNTTAYMKKDLISVSIKLQVENLEFVCDTASKTSSSCEPPHVLRSRRASPAAIRSSPGIQIGDS